MCSKDIAKPNKLKLATGVSSYHMFSFFLCHPFTAISEGGRVGEKMSKS